MKKLLLFFSFVVFVYGIETKKPTKVFLASGNVQSMVYKDGKLYTGCDAGVVEIFDVKSKKTLKKIKLPKIKDFIGDSIDAKIYSIDLFDDTILIVSQGEKGYRDLFLYTNGTLKHSIKIDKKMFIQKANFISKEQVIFALLSNQIGLFDIAKNKLIYLNQISSSSFSHFMLSEDKKTIASSDESGVVRIINVATSRIEKELKAVNLDKVYQLDYKKGNILTAGQDRKAVFFKGNTYYGLDFGFLLYSCALSEDSLKGAIAYNEKNEVLIFDTTTRKYLYNLTGQEATMTQILFSSPNEVFVSSDSKKINYFKLGEKR